MTAPAGGPEQPTGAPIEAAAASAKASTASAPDAPAARPPEPRPVDGNAPAATASDAPAPAPAPVPRTASDDTASAEPNRDTNEDAVGMADFLQDARPFLGGGQYQVQDAKHAGPTVYGDRATINFAVGKGDGERGRLWADPIPRLGLRLATFVTCGTSDRLRRRLGECRAVSLAGAPGSGRLTAACAALAERHGPDRVFELRPAEKIDRWIREQEDLLHKDRGYVIRLTPGASPGLIAVLESVFGPLGSSAVVIRQAETPEDAPLYAEVFHRPPPLLDVLRKHLKFRIEGRCVAGCANCAGACREQYVRQVVGRVEVQQAMEQLTGPREAAQYAERFAAELPRDSEAIVALLQSGHRLRRHARKILLLSADGTGQHTRFDQHRRALRIAYAVLANQPLADVCEAAGLLLDTLDQYFATPSVGRPALLHDVTHLLGEDLAGSLDPDDPAPTAVASRMARVKPELVLALLDVAWNDFDNSRGALIQWLRALAARSGRGFASKAAVAAAVFAYHDFDRLWSKLILPWASEPKWALRRSAALTLVMAADLASNSPLRAIADRRIGPRVDDEVRKLARSGSARERDTAASAWAMGLRPGSPWLAAYDLTHVAEETKHAIGYGIVADAVVQLGRSFGTGWAVSLLHQWVDNDRPGPLRIAALAFAEMVGRPAVHGANRPPRLLTAMADNPELIEPAGALWRLILLEPARSVAAWQVLGDWIRAGRAEPAYRDTVRAMLGHLVTDPAIRRRMSYWVSAAGTAWDGGPAEQPREVS